MINFKAYQFGGYTQIIEKMLNGIEVKVGYDYFNHKEELDNISNNIIFTGPIDKYYDYCYGELEYRSIRFDTEILDIENYQGNAVVNYTEYEIPYTRIIEHKHFEFGTQPKTVISKEYSDKWAKDKEPYYPINNDRNNNLYKKYKELADKQEKIIFGGRLGQYKYYDMDKTVEEALKLTKEVM